MPGNKPLIILIEEAKLDNFISFFRDHDLDIDATVEMLIDNYIDFLAHSRGYKVLLEVEKLRKEGDTHTSIKNVSDKYGVSKWASGMIKKKLRRNSGD